MNKQELINAIAEKVKLSKKDIGSVLEAGMDAVQKSLARGEAVRLVDFGSFDVKQRAAREANNPRNPGEKIFIKARNVIHFKAGKSLQDAANT